MLKLFELPTYIVAVLLLLKSIVIYFWVDWKFFYFHFP